MNFTFTPLDKILESIRRPVLVEPDKEYSEIGVYSFGRGIFHKSPRSAIEIGNKELFTIKPGDFILHLTFAWEGAVAIASAKEEGRYGSTRFLTYKVNEDLCLPQYLLYYFMTKNGLEQLKKISPGSAGRNRVLNTGRFSEVLVPLPLRDVQKKTIDNLEAFFIKFAPINNRVSNIPSLLEKLVLSILQYACSGKLTGDWRIENKSIPPAIKILEKIKTEREANFKIQYERWKNKEDEKPTQDYDFLYEAHPEITTWAKAKLDKLIYIAGRIGWKGLTADEYVEEGPLFLSVSNMHEDEYVNFNGANHVTNERYEESPEIQLQNEDILLVKDGSIGKIAMVKNLKEPTTVNGSILVVRGREAFIPKFLFYFLKGPELQNIAKNRIRRGSTPHLFQRDIRKFIIPVPPLEEQKEIIKQTEKLLNIVYKNQKRHDKIISLAKKLPSAALKSAFKIE